MQSHSESGTGKGTKGRMSSEEASLGYNPFMFIPLWKPAVKTEDSLYHQGKQSVSYHLSTMTVPSGGQFHHKNQFKCS